MGGCYQFDYLSVARSIMIKTCSHFHDFILQASSIDDCAVQCKTTNCMAFDFIQLGDTLDDTGNCSPIMYNNVGYSKEKATYYTKSM